MWVSEMSAPTKLALKMAVRIKEVTGLEVIPKIYRTRAGRHGRAAGAVSWFMMGPSGSCTWVGSQWTVKKCLSSKVLEVHREDLPSSSCFTRTEGDCFLFPSDDNP